MFVLIFQPRLMSAKKLPEMWLITSVRTGAFTALMALLAHMPPTESSTTDILKEDLKSCFHRRK